MAIDELMKLVDLADECVADDPNGYNISFKEAKNELAKKIMFDYFLEDRVSRLLDCVEHTKMVIDPRRLHITQYEDNPYKIVVDVVCMDSHRISKGFQATYIIEYNKNTNTYSVDRTNYKGREPYGEYYCPPGEKEPFEFHGKGVLKFLKALFKWLKDKPC